MENGAYTGKATEIMKGKIPVSYFYPLTFTLPEKPGERVEQTVQTVGDGFIAMWLTWDQSQTNPDKKIEIFDNAIPPVLQYQFTLPSDQQPLRDGEFTVEIRGGASAYYYQSGPVKIRNLAGEPSTGRPVPFPTPIVVGPKDSLTVSIVNLKDRTGLTPEQRRVDLCFSGVQAVKPLGT